MVSFGRFQTIFLNFCPDFKDFNAKLQGAMILDNTKVSAPIENALKPSKRSHNRTKEL